MTYHLQKYAGPSTRHTCPSCGKPRCFTLYVDDNNEPLDPSCGKCDHESSCGYHYPPWQFFKDHPDRKLGKDWRNDRPEWLDRKTSQAGDSRCHSERPLCHSEHSLCHSESPLCHSERSEESVSSAVQRDPKPLCLIPDEIVSRSVSFRTKSYFVQFLDTIFDPVIVEGLIDEYRLGVTRSRAVIFFQIDVEGRCRTGKMMLYDPETGHRIKDESQPNRINWVHALMKKAGSLPADWELTQCLFGEHLLGQYPDKPVALVESEKTAVICAGLMPQFLWLATGGKSQISSEKLSVIGSRKLTAFPDIDGFAEWQRKLSAIPGLNVIVSDILQRNATPEDFSAHIDIADWLLRWHCHPRYNEGSCHSEPSPCHSEPSPCHSERSEESPHSHTFLRIRNYFGPSSWDNIEALIDDLQLEFTGRVEKNRG